MRQYAYLIKLGGDAEISAALHRGVTDGMRQLAGRHNSEAVMRVAIHRGRGSDYWSTRIAEARCLYDTPEPPRLLRALLACYGLIVYLASAANRAQSIVLTPQHHRTTTNTKRRKKRRTKSNAHRVRH